MKSSPPVADRAPGAGSPAAGTAEVHAEGGTRTAVARLLMEQGPCTAAAMAGGLALSAPAVRRHLDAMLESGEAEVRDAPRRGRRGRGRPAREYLLTDTGRARFGHGYDDLAVAALRYLGESGGESAVRTFAARRTAELLGPVERVAARRSVRERVTALAGVLAARGYAAQIHEVGAGGGTGIQQQGIQQQGIQQQGIQQQGIQQQGIQLCQHHCPVAHVAAQFPQLCEAETHAFAELLGTHVQRLSTIARGGAACTTHVPLEAPERRDSDRSAPTTEPLATRRGRDGGSPA